MITCIVPKNLIGEKILPVILRLRGKRFLLQTPVKENERK